MTSSQPSWQDLPLFFKICMVEKLDYKSRCCLRRCSTSEKLLVDSCPVFLHCVKLEKEEVQDQKYTILQRFQCVQTPLEDSFFELSIKEYDEFHSNTCFIKTCSFSELLYIFEPQYSVVDKLVFKGFGGQNSKLTFFNRLKLAIMEKRRNYDCLDLKLRAKSVCWGFEDGANRKELLDFLQFFSSKILKKLCITSTIPVKIFKKLVQTEHWKSLKRVMFVEQVNFSIDHFLHLNRYDIKLKELKLTDIWKAIQKFLFKNSPRLSGFTIFHGNRLSVKDIFKHTILPMHNEPIEGVWGTCHHTQRFKMTNEKNVFVFLILDGWIQGFVGQIDDIDQEYLRFINDFF